MFQASVLTPDIRNKTHLTFRGMPGSDESASRGLTSGFRTVYT